MNYFKKEDKHLYLGIIIIVATVCTIAYFVAQNF